MKLPLSDKPVAILPVCGAFCTTLSPSSQPSTNRALCKQLILQRPSVVYFPPGGCQWMSFGQLTAWQLSKRQLFHFLTRNIELLHNIWRFRGTGLLILMRCKPWPGKGYRYKTLKWGPWEWLGLALTGREARTAWKGVQRRATVPLTSKGAS